MRTLEDGPHANGERLPAGVAFVDADPSALAFQRLRSVYNTAMRAYPTVRPNLRFDIGVGGVLIAEWLGVENRVWHRLSPCCYFLCAGLSRFRRSARRGRLWRL